MLRPDPHPPPLDLHDVAVVQLSPTSAVDLAVHGHEPVDDDLFGIPAGVEQPGVLEKGTQADHLAPDGDVVDRISRTHP